MKIQLRGEMESRRVWLNGKEVSPTKSQGVSNHSPDGFNWGYGGSGPAQLALAICLELWPLTFKERKFGPLPFDYQDFKFKYIATLPRTDFDVEIEIDNSFNPKECQTLPR